MRRHVDGSSDVAIDVEIFFGRDITDHDDTRGNVRARRGTGVGGGATGRLRKLCGRISHALSRADDHRHAASRRLAIVTPVIMQQLAGDYDDDPQDEPQRRAGKLLRCSTRAVFCRGPHVLRVVERIFGEGELQRHDATALPVGYQLAVYRDWHDAAGTLAPGGFVVEGHVMASLDDLRPLVFTAEPLVLRLEDGRFLDVYVVSEEGAVNSADDKGPQERGA
jgi:hypothetical protein